MTKDEFKNWLLHHTERFPTLVDKLEKHHSVKQHWFSVLEATPLYLAKAVSDDMLAGKLDHPAVYEWDRLPSIVRAEAAARADFAKRQTQRQEQPAYKGAWKHVTENDGSMSAAYRAYVRFKDLGYSDEDCRCITASMFGCSTPHQQQRADELMHKHPQPLAITQEARA